MNLVIQREYYRELLGSHAVVRDVVEDAAGAWRVDQKVYEQSLPVTHDPAWQWESFVV